MMIKREPGAGSLFPADQLKTNGEKVSRAEPKCDSRPPLKEKTTNTNVTQKSSTAGIEQKRKLVSKIVLPIDKQAEISASRPPTQGNCLVKSEQSVLSFQSLKRSPSLSKEDALEEIAPPGKRPNTEQKQPLLSDSIRNVVSIDHSFGESNTSQMLLLKSAAPLNPGPYDVVANALHEADIRKETASYYQEVFKDVKDEVEQKACINFAKMDLQQWISLGQSLQEEHISIMGRFIESRIRLSEKFRVITKLINDRAIALNAQGEILDQKLRKIQDLGREILEII